MNSISLWDKRNDASEGDPPKLSTSFLFSHKDIEFVISAEK